MNRMLKKNCALNTMPDDMLTDRADSGFRVKAYERLRRTVTEPGMTPLRAGL